MKNDIIREFGQDKIMHRGYYSDEFHVVDYTKRTMSKRDVEVHCIKPTDIESLKVVHQAKLHITASIFKPHCFWSEADEKYLKQCECVLYPTRFTNDSWIMFVEIKDCKPKSYLKYRDNIKDKFRDNVKVFRDKGIFSQNKVVHAVASFPRKGKTDFHTQFIPLSEIKDFRDSHKIIIKGTNEITIENEQTIL